MGNPNLPTGERGSQSLEVLSMNPAFRVARLFHRWGSKTVEEGAELLRQALHILLMEGDQPILVAGAGLIWVRLSTPTRTRYPDAGEFAAITETARQVAEAVRASLPVPHPLIVLGVDVFATSARSDIAQGAGQFAVILPGEGPTQLLPKRFPTPTEWAFLHVMDEPPEPVCDTPHGRALTLVCHDLNVYHPRGEATTSHESRAEWRTTLRSQILELKPAFGLHLAHYVGTAATFRQSYRVWQREVGVPLVGVSGLPAGVSTEQATTLAASLLTDEFPTLDLCERAE